MKRGRIMKADTVLVPSAWLADRWWSRLRGLLGRPPLAEAGDQALIIRPCNSIHTFGMRYAIDVVFIDREQRVCGWREHVRPWRAAACAGSHAVIELRSGSLKTLRPALGEHWEWKVG